MKPQFFPFHGLFLDLCMTYLYSLLFKASEKWHQNKKGEEQSNHLSTFQAAAMGGGSIAAIILLTICLGMLTLIYWL